MANNFYLNKNNILKKHLTLRLIKLYYKNEDENKIEIDMCNLRLNADLIMSGQENEDQFMRAYAAGERMDNPKDFRTSVIELSGFETEPTVTATGSNGAKMSTKWSSDGTLTLTIISNGEVRITIE